MKRRVTLILLIILALLPLPARADGDFSIGAKAACLIDAATGRILYQQNAHERYPMASTTKVMTALLALENASLEEYVTAGENASGVEGTSIYLSVGETLTMRDMLYGLMLRSGNDAAVAIAEHISGSVDDFAELMNRRAVELGADAIFSNPHGLPAQNHEATAHAMCRIARQAMQNPTFREIVSTKKATIPWIGNEYSRVLSNKNRLLTDYPGATGIKTGFTKAAGRCLVFSAQRDGMELIGCVLNCPDWFNEAMRLLDYGFDNFDATAVLHAGQTAARTAVSDARNPSLALTVAEDFLLPLAAEEHYVLDFHAETARAPVQKGQKMGYAAITINGLPIAQVPLIAAEDVPEWGLLSSLRHLLQFWAFPR